MTIPFAESLCSSFEFIESIVFNVLVLHKTPSGESQINLTGFVPNFLSSRHTHADPMKQPVYHSDLN